jgi:ATP-dependent protease HslVU (ClpYQ) ATPase subunit
VIADATALTEAGYVGEDVENILLKLIQAGRAWLRRVGRAAACARARRRAWTLIQIRPCRWDELRGLS